jgi:formylglycine-generating enzyme required for sulfatase activity
MVRSAAGLVLAICFALAGLVQAEAQLETKLGRRVALVIGNADYKVGPLGNPVNDAEAVAEVLERQLKFDKVILRTNLKAQAFRAALLELSREALGAEVAALFFAGHGTEVNGKNYLIPVDAGLAKAGDLGLEAIPLDLVLEQLAGATRLKLVILDACRNNVFPMAGARRAVTRGLSRIEPEDNTLVVYAAKEGTTADDGPGQRHSPFTAALLKHIATPGLEVTFVFRRVRDEVVASTSPVQTPHVYGTLGGAEVYLLPKAGHTLLPPAPPSSGAAQAWAAAKDSTSIAVLEAFRRQYGATDPFYDRLAQERIDELRRQQIALLEAEEKRRKAEEEKKSDPARSVVPGSGASFRDCPECPEMVVVPAGSFTMGSPLGEQGRDPSEGPQRRVTIARPFAIGKFEVTRGEFAAFVQETGWSVGDRCYTYEGAFGDRTGRSFRYPGFQQDDRHPVVCINWQEATAYVGWLSRKTGKTYRLLTEAEWEHAARAGTTTLYHFGSKAADLCRYGNVGDLTASARYRWKTTSATAAICRDGYVHTAPVGSFLPNALGLYDMHGNVSEWVQDCWNASYIGAPVDGSAWTAGDCGLRGIRGASWYFSPRYQRAANRSATTIVDRGDDRGFRVARTL